MGERKETEKEVQRKPSVRKITYKRLLQTDHMFVRRLEVIFLSAGSRFTDVHERFGAANGEHGTRRRTDPL